MSKEYWEITDNNKFKWTAKGRWEIRLNFMALIVGISLYGQVNVTPLLVKVLGGGFILIAIIGIIELTVIKWKADKLRYYKWKKDVKKMDSEQLCTRCKDKIVRNNSSNTESE